MKDWNGEPTEHKTCADCNDPIPPGSSNLCDECREWDEQWHEESIDLFGPPEKGKS